MDRRTLLRGLIASVTAGGLPCCGRARAKQKFHGCAVTAASAESDIRVLDPSTDLFADLRLKSVVGGQAVSVGRHFGVRAAVFLIDDSDGANAFATPRVYSPDGPDGTVLFGINLLRELDAMEAWLQTEALIRNHENSTFAALHEMGHILQFKKGMASLDRWEMEPHADFLAGWAYANTYIPSLSVPDSPFLIRPKRPEFLDKLEMNTHLEEGAAVMFSLGDTAFNDPSHHGEPQFRAAMVRAGFDSANLSVDEAFERGKKYAGLP